MAEHPLRKCFTIAVVLSIAIASNLAAGEAASDAPQPVRTEQEPEDAEPDEFYSRYDDEIRDVVDAAAPLDSKAAKLLRQAEMLFAQRKWERAQEVLLFTLDRAGEAMIRRRDGQLVSVVAEANRLLGELPQVSLELYRRQYGPAAEKALASAITRGDHSEIERIAVQFRHTDAGREALRRIASIHFDRGEFGLAAVRYRQLAEDRLEPAVRVRAAYASAAAGDAADAERLLSGLTDADRTALRKEIDVDRIVASATERAATTQAVSDWLFPQGDAAGSAVATAGEPVLLRRWSHPLTDRPALQEQIDGTEQDLRDEDRATILAAVPLAVGDLTVSRTLRGIAVHAVSTGRLLWETAEENSAERLLASGRQRPATRMQAAIRFQIQFGPNPSASSGDNKPLPNLLYRNGVHGFLTSDGTRVFAVEDHFPAASNQLVAYDLQSGRPAWPEYGAIGGLLTDGPFDAPLAGYTFFGPPVPAGDEMYAIGEKDKEIHLIAIDPAQGSVLWNRLIAHAQTAIDQDPVRHDWPAMVAVSDGVLVCPTTVGWVMGVDQSSRSILWASRYAPPQSDRKNQEMNAAASPTRLNHRWCPSSPVIHRGRVLLTPAEETRLICLDLFTGELLWQRDKGTALYVAGVRGDLLVTVGTDAVEGIDVASGAERWTLPIPDDAGQPSGRAVLSEERLSLPLRGDTLWQIDIEGGDLLASKKLRPDEPALGNLVMHQGTLLSYSTAGLTAFEERTELTRQADARLQQNPDDVIALLRTAELHHTDGDPIGAAAILERIDPKDVAPEQANGFRRLRWDVLATLVRTDRTAGDDRLSRLAEIAESAEERLTVRRLEADRASAAGDSEGAARAYLALLSDVSGESFVIEDEGRRQVRLTEWLAGRFADLWTATEGDAHSALDTLIASALQAATTDEERHRTARIFAFHPAAAELARRLAGEDLEAGRLAEAEAHLLPLVTSSDDDVVGAARLDLAKAATRFGLTADARHWHALARRRTHNESPVQEQESNAVSSEDASTGDDETTLVPEPGVSELWGGFQLSVVRSGGYTSNESPVDVIPENGEMPFFRDRRLQFLARKSHLAVSGDAGAGLEQIIPIRSDSRSTRRFVALADGHLLFFLHGGVVQAISPAEGRVLWSAPTPDRIGGGFAGEESPEAMRPAGGLAGKNGLIAKARSRDALPAACASYVAVVGRDEIFVRDSMTGDVRWSRNDLPHEAIVIGTENILYVLPQDAIRRAAYRAIDGQSVPLGKAGELLPLAVGFVGDRLLTVTAEEPPFRLFDLPIGRRSVVSLQDPQTGSAVWTRAYPADTLFDVTVDGRLCALSPNGELTELDTETGEPSALGSIPVEVLRGRSEAYLLTDADSTYVAVNAGRGPSFFAAEMPAIPIGGHIFAFDRTSGELRWRREVRNQRLLCQEFGHLPVLLLIDSERTNRGGQGLWQVDLLALDKRTGKAVLDEPYFTTSTPFFHALTVQPERRSIELTAYHTRLRLQAVPAAEDTAPQSSDD
ncbi:MAG: PQQ-binding-like beta-propeller repeat protein [Planctomycetaceae bacterium]